MGFDVARVRGLFPSLGDGWVPLDPLAGVQLPDAVSTTVSTTFRASVSPQPIGRHAPRGRRGASVVAAARQAVADLVGGVPEGVVLGASRAALLAALADAVTGQLDHRAAVVVSRLDDEDNIVPWLRLAQRVGAEVRWAEVDVSNATLPPWQYEGLLTGQPRLVAVCAANALLGTVPEVRSITDAARARGALSVVDAATSAAHEPVSLAEIGADVLALDARLWGGPPVGALVLRDPGLADAIDAVSTDPHARGVERLEIGAPQTGLLGGLVASIDHLAALDETASGPRAHRLRTSLGAMRYHHAHLLDHLLTVLRGLPAVTVLGAPQVQLPRVSFVVRGVSAESVATRLHANGVLAAVPEPGTSRLLAAMGIEEVGGAVTVGIAQYTTHGDIDHLARTIASLGG